MKMKLFEPYLTRAQANRRSFIACVACGTLLTILELWAGHTRAAVAALPLCFASWWFIDFECRVVDRLTGRRPR